MVQKSADGKLKITNDKGADPGAARGALVGGVAGWALATLAGPIGLGAMIGGAAIGAITAKVKDSGIKNDDVDTVTGFMVAGRTGLMLAIPLEDAGRWDEFVEDNAEFHSAIRRHQMDITRRPQLRAGDRGVPPAAGGQAGQPGRLTPGGRPPRRVHGR